MRNRIGALLCLAFGIVLVVTGFNGTASGTVGSSVPIPDCGGTIVVGVPVLNPGTCPTGTIDLTEATDLSDNPDAVAPQGWQVSLRATGDPSCNLPADESDTDSDPAVWTRLVPNNGSVSFENLFIFNDRETDSYCHYRIDETAVDGFTGTFDPTAPYSFTYTPLPPADETSSTTEVPRVVAATRAPAAAPRDLNGPSPLAVTLHNVAAAAPTSPTPTPTSTTRTVRPSSSVTSTVSSSASSSPVSASTSAPIACGPDSGTATAAFHANRCVGPSLPDSNSNDPASASSSAALANTGPSRPLRPTMFIGVALCLLGGVLLIAGRRRRGEHA